jgi:uncharacterized membrane protein
MGWDRLRVVAGIGVALQGYFAYKETIGWGPAFVTSAAPVWVGHLPTAQLPPESMAAITWATPLAFNMGIYNLVLAIGLLWVAVAGARVAASLGTFLGVWLLVAATAALWTQVYPAFMAQGLLGLAVLLLSIRSAQGVDKTSPPQAAAA